jgi:hypothetical protein
MNDYDTLLQSVSAIASSVASPRHLLPEGEGKEPKGASS